MKKMRDGFYTEPHTTNTIAVKDNVGYYVSIVDGKKIISTERQIFSSSIIEKWKYEAFSEIVKKSYIVVDENNEWQSLLNDVTPLEFENEMADIKKDGMKGIKIFAYVITGEVIEFEN